MITVLKHLSDNFNVHVLLALACIGFLFPTSLYFSGSLYFENLGLYPGHL